MMNTTHVLIILRGVMIELLRRRDFVVLLIFALAYLLFVAAARFAGIDDPATGTFLLNLSLSLITVLAHIVALTTAWRQLPDEIDKGTIYPLLARPVSRAEVLLGKWAAGAAAGGVLFAALAACALLLVPRIEVYELSTLLQLLVLQLPALAMTGAIGILFSLLLPRLPGLLIAAALVFGSGALVRFAGRWYVPYLLPDPWRLNLVLRYTDGIAPLSGYDFILLFFYGSLWTCVMLFFSSALFQRRRI